MFRRHGDQLLLFLHVTPKSHQDRVVGFNEEAQRLHVKVRAVPENGEANQQVINILSKALGIRKSAMVLMTGETSRHKTVAISGVDLDDVERILRNGFSSSSHDNT